ncbi:MAG: 50S ribosomal protein L35 [Paenibacillaceae bacterium]
MPKMKTHRGAAKRFSKTGSGKIKINHSFKRHQLEGKSPGRKRKLGKIAIMTKGDHKRIAQMITYVK